MKYLKIFSPLLVIVFILNSCIIERPREYVEACFSVQGTDHVVGEPVTFVNCSRYAYEYFWDFDDGFTSNQRSPSHVFDVPGTYQVTLTAYGEYSNEYDVYTTDVTVYGSTDLDILVMYEGTSDPATGALVEIYETYTDWQNITNIIADGYTDDDGLILFRDLDPIIYFIWAELDEDPNDSVIYTNEELRIETDPLILNTVNYYNIYIRQYTVTKSARSAYSITKIEKSSKEEQRRLIEAAKLK
jgi:hypothetical protein